MKLKIYSIYDMAARNYNRPFYQHTKGEAVRSFTDLANDGESMISKHPQDYFLFELGTFEDESGAITTHDAPVKCISAQECVADA